MLRRSQRLRIQSPLIKEDALFLNVGNLIKKPRVLIRDPYMDPKILGVIGPGFLNQVPTVLRQHLRLGRVRCGA